MKRFVLLTVTILPLLLTCVMFFAQNFFPEFLANADENLYKNAKYFGIDNPPKFLATEFAGDIGFWFAAFLLFSFIVYLIEIIYFGEKSMSEKEKIRPEIEIRNSKIERNGGGTGGGLRISGNVKTLIENCTFADNKGVGIEVTKKD